MQTIIPFFGEKRENTDVALVCMCVCVNWGLYLFYYEKMKTNTQRIILHSNKMGFLHKNY